MTPRLPSNSALGWALVVAAFAVGYALYGWPGVLLAFTITVFWLLLQFSRVLRVMRKAAMQPPGHVEGAVMLASRLRPGLRMIDVLALTGSLGRRLPHPSPGAQESWEWSDAGGDAVVVDFSGGRTLGATLERRGPGETPAPGPRIEG